MPFLGEVFQNACKNSRQHRSQTWFDRHFSDRLEGVRNVSVFQI